MHSHTRVVVRLAVIVVLLGAGLCPLNAARCRPREVNPLTAQCLPFIQNDFLLAIFGHDTAFSTWYCSAWCHVPWSHRDEMSLRLEMEQWIRSNRTVGMFPEAYIAVLREVKELIAKVEKNRTSMGPTSVEYARKANTTLRNMPWLLLSPAAVNRAVEYYTLNVKRRHIVRVVDVCSARGNPDLIVRYLMAARDWWMEAQEDVARDPRLAPPYIPWVDVERFVGVPLSRTINGTKPRGREQQGKSIKRNMKGSSFPHPLTAVPALVYYYSDDCAVCHSVGAAFDLVPFVFRRLCEHGHHFILSCSPVLMFFRAEATTSQLVVPRFTYYGPRRSTVLNVFPTFSLIIDLEDNDLQHSPFEGIDLSLGSDIHLEAVVTRLLQRLVDFDVIQTRSSNAGGVVEFLWPEGDRVEDGWPGTYPLRVGNLSVSGHEKTGGSNTPGNGLTLDMRLERAVRFHLMELWGGEAAGLDRLGEVKWPGIHLTCVKAMVAVLAMAWFLLRRLPPGDMEL